MTKNWMISLNNYAKGEFILILSDDDFLIDNLYIRKAIELFGQYPNIVLVVANCLVLYENSGVITSTNYNLKENSDGLSYLLN